MEKSMGLVEIEKKKSVFKNKDFLLLFFGKLVSQLGDSIFGMAIGWFILTITSSAVQMSAYMAMGTVVYVIMGPIGGVIADKIDRKKLVILMDIIRGVTVAAIGLLMYFNFKSIWLLYIASVILSICGAIFVPASNALIPNIVNTEDLTKANSVSSMINGISGIVGLIAGGILYAVLGIKAIFLLNAVSYIICGILEMFITVKPMQKAVSTENKTHLIKELIDSYKYIKSLKGLFILMWLGTLINFILVPLPAIFMPYIFNQILKASPQQYSYVGAASAIGFILGGVLLSMLPQKDKISIYLRSGMGVNCVLVLFIYFALQGYYKSFLTTGMLILALIIIYGLTGIANTFINVPLGVVMQKSIPNEMLGKTSALSNTLIMCSIPLAMMAGGIVTDILPMQYIILIIFIVLTSTTIYLCTQKDIREI